MTATALNALSAAYGKAPHEWLEIDDALLAFDWEIYSRAAASDKR